MTQLTSTPLNLLVIDSQVNNYQSLAAAAKPDTAVLILDASKDGLTQISDYLNSQSLTADYAPLQSIQIISHGNAGELYLGSSTVTSANINDYTNQLSTLGEAIAAKGDILLYGCDLAGNAAGLDLINQFSALTHKDVAASTDLTGSALLGGNWILEAATGSIEAGLTIDTAVVNAYVGTLAGGVNNNVPSLNAFNPGTYVTTAPEDTTITFTLASLSNAGLADGAIGLKGGPAITSFQVTNVLFGTLLIGIDEASAIEWGTGNDKIDAENSAFWIPNVNDNGPFTAFEFKAINANGTTINAVGAPVFLTPVNDAPVFAPAIDPLTDLPIITPLINGLEDTEYVVGNYELTQDFIDPDGDGLIIANLTADHGSVINNGDSTYTITPDANYNGTLTLSFDVSDGLTFTPATKTLEILPANDLPTVAGTTGAELLETNEFLSTSGQLTIDDIDVGENYFIPVTDIATAYGTFNMNSTGYWTYTTTTATDLFVDTWVYGEEILVNTADGTEFCVCINITGTNDAAVLSDATAELIQSTIALDTSGQLTISDIDNPNAPALPTFNEQINTAGNYGVFNIDATGAWSFTAYEAYQSLAEGETLSETFYVTSDDLTTSWVTVNIIGTNDAAVITGAVANPVGISAQAVTNGLSADLIETDAVLSTTGKVNVTDIDSSASIVAQTDTAGTYGVFNIDATGAWTYEASSAHNEFVGGQTYTDTFTINSADGTPATITVNILGTDDISVLSEDVANLTETNAILSTSGTLIITDVDNNPIVDSFIAQTDHQGTYGTFSIDSTGAWTYNTSNAHNEFVAGQTYTDSFSVLSTNGNSTTVTVNLLGTDDAPTLSAVSDINYIDTACVDNFATFDGQLSASDIDSGNLTYGLIGGTDNGDGTISQISTYGTLTVTTATGAYSFVPNSATINALGIAATASFSLTVSDGTTTVNTPFNISVTQSGITECNLNDNLTGSAGNDIFNGLAGNDVINGLAGDDTIYGGLGNDTLNGGLDNDTMNGNLGDDTYIIDNIGDTVFESLNEGIDTVLSSINYQLGLNVENLTLTGEVSVNARGNNLNNLLIGNSASNFIFGYEGSDTMIGGLGNDVYYIDNIGDQVFESLNEGIDTVYSAINYSLGSNIEYLTLMGSAINATGNSLNNYIIGTQKSNIIDGNLGADTMIGGLGNDTYTIDNIGDTVFESLNEGIDTVLSSINYQLGLNVENLTLTGEVSVNARGNNLNNLLIGNSASNFIFGYEGSDTMIGGLGNDVYYIDNIGDQVFESLNEGIDTVYSAINYSLGSNIEYLTLMGSAINATGNSLNNYIIGTQNSNTLNGGLGNDTLVGGAGDDIFQLFNLSCDKITDFTVGQDKIQLGQNAFTALPTLGVLSADNFGTGSAATTANQHIIYNSATGALSYDADGNGAEASVQIALLGVNLNLSNTDFSVIA